MPELRQDPVTKEWVIIANERSKRPSDFKQVSAPPSDPSECPFCPGHESMTPDPVLVMPRGGGWGVRVIPNKFPALRPESSSARRIDGLNRSMEGFGHHEVVIETPDHEAHPALMTEKEVADVIEAYHQRYNALIVKPGIEMVTLFRNHGLAAGTSLSHPHSQIVATPIIPYSFRHKILQTMHYFDDTGRCIFCDLVEQELRMGARVVEKTDAFVVIAPWASKKPFELLIIPRRHESSFGKTTPEERRALAVVLRRTLRRLYDALANPDYNLMCISAPYQEDPADYYHWRIQILPRLSKDAGFELGSGIYINPTPPEECAAALRAIAPTG